VISGCIDCGDDWVVVRGRCDTCYRRARRMGVIDVIIKRITPSEVDEMRRLKTQGLSMDAIGRSVGRSVTSVQRHAGGIA
jgi:hypothetical protein